MFGEYAQVANYIGPTDSLETGAINLSYLPSYLLPTFSQSSPWSHEHDVSKPGANEDFIIVAEFSEIEGPKPLLTIPCDGGHGFDKNAFSVKIMAVDHQTSTSGFSISEDTQVIVTDSGEFQVSAFVHHFVLYDNQARGFVRPFCMAYVTKELRKIMNCYEEMSLHFKKVSRFFKYGNKMVFVKDLERHSQDLEYTKGILIGKFNNPNDDNGCEEEAIYKDLQNIQCSLAEIREILVVLKPLLNDKRLETRFHTLESRAWKESNKKDKNLDSMSLQERWFSEHGDEHTYRYGSFNDVPDNPLHLFNKAQSYSPKLVETKRKKKFDRTLRGLHELCSWGAKEGMKKLRCIYEHFKREAMILELEKEEMNLFDPPSSVLSCGQCVTHNFLSNLSLRPPDCPAFSQPFELAQRWSSLDTLEGSVGSFKSMMSDDSLRTAQSSDSFTLASEGFYDDDTMFSSGIETYDKQNGQLQQQKCTVKRDDSNLSASSSMTDTDNVPSVYESFPNSPVKTPDRTMARDLTDEDLSSEITDTVQDSIEEDRSDGTNTVSVSESEITIKNDAVEAQSSTEVNSKVTSCSGESDGNIGGIAKDVDDCAENRKKLQLEVERQYSETDDTADTCTTPSSESARPAFASGSSALIGRKPRGGLHTIGDLLFNLRHESPGIGLCDALYKYNNIQHVINSVMTGRLVLVIGQAKHEAEVIRLVTALSLFLPNHRRKHHAVLEWSSKPLRLTDLSRIKLAGVCRSEKRSVESFVKKYCSILDVDKKVIIAPPYQGTVISTIVSKKKTFKTDADFIAFTHCWLMEIAAKAFIFYHSFCLGSTDIISHESSLACHRQQYCNSVKSFIVKLGVSEGDSAIIEYFAEVIKLLQIDQTPYEYPHEDGVKVSPVSLSYQTCQLFRC